MILRSTPLFWVSSAHVDTKTCICLWENLQLKLDIQREWHVSMGCVWKSYEVPCFVREPVTCLALWKDHIVYFAVGWDCCQGDGEHQNWCRWRRSVSPAQIFPHIAPKSNRTALQGFLGGPEACTPPYRVYTYMGDDLHLLLPRKRAWWISCLFYVGFLSLDLYFSKSHWSSPQNTRLLHRFLLLQIYGASPKRCQRTVINWSSMFTRGVSHYPFTVHIHGRTSFSTLLLLSSFTIYIYDCRCTKRSYMVGGSLGVKIVSIQLRCTMNKSFTNDMGIVQNHICLYWCFAHSFVDSRLKRSRGVK